ncbi:MAG TPA: DUF2155 domain-containing protein [Caulobacteraceae bacterium]|jgi:hypothetical protein|nr:DUF2155 domain-containing protein [Caulobacteraceae bacterium]
MRTPPARFVFVAAVALMLGVAGGAFVRAQQGEPATASPSAAPPAPTDEAPPPPDSALSAAIVAPPSPPGEVANVQPAPTNTAEASSQAAKAEPLKRPRYGSAVLQALDKVTAQTLRFEAPINKPIRYKSLIFVVRACETTAPDEGYSDASAHVEVDSQPLPPDGKAPPPPKQVFRGWMFANSPGVDLFQHPVYDAWLIACKTDQPSA